MAFRRQVKNFVKNYSDAEIKVREATSNDPWGPSSSLMLDISDLTFNTISLSEIMNMLWHRLDGHGKNWRHVYKSLTLMDYLIKNGSEKVIQHCRERFCKLQTLKDFQHIDEAGKDQGYYIREKSKQVITLLMDEQLLWKEREVACRTRQRTSYSLLFSKRVFGSSSSLIACASAPTPDTSASEKKYKLPKFGRLRNKKNVCKAELKQEHCQDIHYPTETMFTQETLPLKIQGWKSTEELILFSDDEPKQLLPAAPPSIVSPVTCLSEAAEVCTLLGADAVPTLSGNSPSLQTDVSLDKRSDGTLTNTVTENRLETPLEKQSAAEDLKTLTILPAYWLSSKEEFISPNLRISKSDSTFHNQASVETLSLSPSVKIFDPVKKIVINKAYQKPAQASIIQMDDKILKTTTQVSTASEEASTFSPLSMSSPDLASPEKSAHLLSPILARPSSFWTLSHQQMFSASFKDKDKSAKLHHSFASKGPVSSDAEENCNLNLLGIRPNNSDFAKKNIKHTSSSHWGEFCTQNVDQFIPLCCSGFRSTKDFSRELEAKNSISVLLREVKSALARLREDLSTLIQELSVINSHLMSVSLNSSQMSQSSQVPQSSEGSADQI
ncbi:ENTH domain-containing protein 1 [Aotus nancymaae]|uniref:ENTH domain-containing protein 1 n=1 Tax=Aotus nancymaae TaxID=37293 RepID=UPI00062566C5|nr:ENTH domain-containing protein 1 [Aotus nancymaae]